MKNYMKILMLSLLVLFTLPQSSCSTDGGKREASHLAFADDVFYFKSATEYRMENGVKVSSTLIIESGSIHIYGDVIVTRRTTGPINYFIESRSYDEDDQIYHYCTTEDVEITFDICNKRLKIEDGDDGIEFYIDSDIKSNW